MCLKVYVVPFRLPSLIGMSNVPGPLRIKVPDSHGGSVPVTLSATGSRTSACDIQTRHTVTSVASTTGTILNSRCAVRNNEPFCMIAAMIDIVVSTWSMPTHRILEPGRICSVTHDVICDAANPMIGSVRPV